MTALANRDNLATVGLTPTTFPAFYRRLIGLRFPLDVAEVIEMRDVIHCAADAFTPPERTTAYRQFIESIRAAIDVTKISSLHHVDRLIHIMTMIRELHYSHRINARAAEVRIHQRRADNRDARVLSVRYGILMFVVALLLFFVWLALGETSWLLPVSMVFLAYMSCDYFYSLAILDREYRLLARDLSEIREEGADSWNWKDLIHRLALVLGYKRGKDVNVFLIAPKEATATKKIQ